VTNPNDFFGGAPTLSWAITLPDGSWQRDEKMLNVVRGGTIMREPVVQQMVKFGSGEPMFWDEAKTDPKEQMVLTLRCDGQTHPTSASGAPIPVRDERTGPTDTGERSLYINSGEMKKAVKAAYTAAGAQGLAVGGQLYVIMTGSRPSKIKGGYPASTYHAIYVPPVHGVQTSRGDAQAAPWEQSMAQPSAAPQAPAQPQQQAAPAHQPAPWEQPAAGQAANPYAGQPVPAGSKPPWEQ
jgi:hypothetical protein